MNLRNLFSGMLGILVFFTCFPPCISQENLSAEELVKRNIKAIGGKDKIEKIKNYSFQANQQMHYISSLEEMKIISGKEPIITGVILVNKDKVQRNCYNKITEIKGLTKATYQTLAKLRSGLFTLKNFRGQLVSKGIKKYGRDSFYKLTAEVGNLNVEFYVCPEKYLIRRMVFSGYDPVRGRYEVNHDFGYHQEIEGILLPVSWYSSQVGSRGNVNEISHVRINQSLEKDFFENRDVNVGKVEISQGILKGNIIDFDTSRKDTIVLSTNLTIDCIEKAGFEPKDTLILKIEDLQIEIVFHALRPPGSAYHPGAKMMIPNGRDENYIIYILSSEYEKLIEKLRPLLPIQIKEKS